MHNAEKDLIELLKLIEDWNTAKFRGDRLKAFEAKWRELYKRYIVNV